VLQTRRGTTGNADRLRSSTLSLRLDAGLSYGRSDR
jgi:hypothetical protein